MKTPARMAPSPLREQAVNTLLRARKLPRGPYRNDLRQLGLNLLWLHRQGIRANVEMFDRPTRH